MFQKKLMWLSSYLLLSSSMASYGHDSDFITYEWLADIAAQTSYTDHIPHWRRLFNTMKVRGFLECGCGYSTSYFLNNAEKVISIEYVTPGYGADWYHVCKSLLSDHSNWIPMTYNQDYRSNSFNNACAYQCSMHEDYAVIDPTYLMELHAHFKQLISEAKSGGYEIDVAFVDPGVYVRGDLVKLLLKNNVPIVAAHDTNSDKGVLEKDDLYGWNKVITPSNYVKIHIPYGQGTTFWINENYSEVIDSMYAYRDAILEVKAKGREATLDDVTRFADR